MRFRLPALVALLVVLAAGGNAVGAAVVGGSTAPVTGSGPADARASSPVAEVPSSGDRAADDRVRPRPGPNLTRPDPAVVVEVNLTPAGDARWTVASRFNVSNETDAEAFRAFADSLQEGGRNDRLGYSSESFERLATVVDDRTNRSGSMRIRDASWSSEVTNETGVLALSFTWTNFARTDGPMVILDDVFGAGNGGLLGSIEDGQRLILNAPQGYAATSSRFPVANGTIVLDGPRDLDTSDTPIVYAPISTPGQSTSQSTSGSTTDPREGFPWLFGGGLVLLLVLVVAGVVLLSRRDLGEAEPDPQGTTDGGETTADAGGAASSPAEDGATTPDEAAGAVAAADEEAAAGGDEDAEDVEEIDVELLSDEERVERLLEENGGRMKQATIVTETGWSNAKVSQLLSSMDEEGRIDKLRIGRENLITLPDEDVGEVD